MSRRKERFTRVATRKVDEAEFRFNICPLFSTRMNEEIVFAKVSKKPELKSKIRCIVLFSKGLW